MASPSGIGAARLRADGGCGGLRDRHHPDRPAVRLSSWTRPPSPPATPFRHRPCAAAALVEFRLSRRWPAGRTQGEIAAGAGSGFQWAHAQEDWTALGVRLALPGDLASRPAPGHVTDVCVPISRLPRRSRRPAPTSAPAVRTDPRPCRRRQLPRHPADPDGDADRRRRPRPGAADGGTRPAAGRHHHRRTWRGFGSAG